MLCCDHRIKGNSCQISQKKQAVPRTAEDYRYAAFISYRHVEPDRSWAKWLHSAGNLSSAEKILSPAARPRLPRRRGTLRLVRPEPGNRIGVERFGIPDRHLFATNAGVGLGEPRSGTFPRDGPIGQNPGPANRGGADGRLPAALREIRRDGNTDGMSAELLEEVEPLAADARNAHGGLSGRARRSCESSRACWAFTSTTSPSANDIASKNGKSSSPPEASSSRSCLPARSPSACARTMRRANALAHQFESGISEHQWSAAHLNQMDGLLAEWTKLSPEDARAAAGQLNGEIAADVEIQTRHPYLSPSEVDRIPPSWRPCNRATPPWPPGLQPPCNRD